MVLVDINQIQLASTTSDIVIARDIEREVLYRRAELLAVGTKLLPTRPYGVLDVKFEFPSDIVGEYPVAEGGMAKLEGITWTPFNMSMEKAQVHYDITDESKARTLANHQMATGRRKAAEALATLLDHHILGEVIAGTFSGNAVAVAPGDEWNSGNASADVEDNITDAITNILVNSRVTLEMITNVNMVYPATAYKVFKKTSLIGNIQTRLEDYFSTSFGLTAYPTRYTDVITGMPTGISDDAYVVIHSEDAGIIGSFNPPPGSGIPMAEVWREHGVGERHLFTNWFKAKIQPLSDSDATSPYIAAITNAVLGP